MMSMRKSLNTSALVTADSPKGQRATETFRAQYNKAGLTEETAQILDEHSGFAPYMLAGIRRFSMKAPDYALAQSILGVDFIMPKEVTKARPSIVYTDEQVAALAKAIPSVEVLEWCKKNGYAVMPAPPSTMSMLEVQTLKPDFFYSKTGGWYVDQKFAHEDKTSFGWLVIKKMSVANSTSKNWNQRNKLLSKLETVPNAAEMSWFITTYFEVRGVRLFEGIYVRTSSLVSDGCHVNVGHFGSEGLFVYYCWDVGRYEGIGLSAIRKQ